MCCNWIGKGKRSYEGGVLSGDPVHYQVSENRLLRCSTLLVHSLAFARESHAKGMQVLVPRTSLIPVPPSKRPSHLQTDSYLPPTYLLPTSYLPPGRYFHRQTNAASCPPLTSRLASLLTAG